MAAEYVVADTTVVSHLTKTSPHSTAYDEILGERRLAVSFQTTAELKGAGFGRARQLRVDALLAATLRLPQSESTDVWYARVAEKRKDLRKLSQSGANASDADVWIISSALEYGLPLLSHDTQQVYLGRAAGLRVLTNLEGLREDNPQT